MTEQLNFPFPPLQPTFLVAVRPAALSPTPGLVPLDAARPGDLIALMSSHHADFECNETVRPELEVFLMMGTNGPETVRYDALDGAARAMAAQVALEALFLTPCIHEDVTGLGVVHEPLFYDVYSFRFSGVRILMDKAALTEPRFLFDDLEVFEGEPVFPCAIEVNGDLPLLARTMIAERHLQHAVSSLPERLRPAPGTFRFR